MKHKLSKGDGLKLHFVSFASPIRRNFKQEPVYFTIIIRPVTIFIVHDREDKVDSNIGMSYRPASLCRLPGRYNNPMPESTLSSQSGTMNLTADLVPSRESRMNKNKNSIRRREHMSFGKGNLM
jgi:hypothetical protein